MSVAQPTLRVALVDDEPLARARLAQLLAECKEPAATVVGEAADVNQALAFVGQGVADVLMLDIGLPGRSGLQLAQGLRALATPPMVVFVTAHAQHALQAFELDAVDYLTKPVRRERLQDALRRVAQRLQGPVAPTPSAAAAGAAEPPMLVVSDRGRVLRIPVAEVLYLKAEWKYVTLRTAQQRYVLDDPLSELHPRLGDGFIRIHRNALVARHAMRRLQRAPLGSAAEASGEQWAVWVSPVEEWLAVSRRQVAAVRAALLAPQTGER